MTVSRLAHAAACGSAWLGGAVILASAILVAAEVVARNFGLGLRLHAFEWTNYGFATAVAFSFSYAMTMRSHIRIDFLYQVLPVRLRAVLDLVSVAGIAAVASGMAWFAWRVVGESLRLGARPNSTLDIPLALPQALWAAGLTWFALVAAVLTAEAVILLLKGRLEALHRRAGVVHEAESEMAGP